MEIAHGFTAAERGAVGAAYWEAFRGKLSPAFAAEEVGQAVVTALLDADRFLVARAAGRVLGVCGFRADGRGATTGGRPQWRRVRDRFGWGVATRAAVVLAPLRRGDVAGSLVLDGVCVDVAHRGQGVGTALLGAATDLAAARGERAVQLSVVDTNPRAEALYRRCGFVPVHRGDVGALSAVYGFRRYTTMRRPVPAAQDQGRA